MSDWSALEGAAAALRRINEAVTAHYASDTELHRLATALERIASSYESRPRRDKERDTRTRPHLDRLYSGEHAPLDVDDGEAVEFDPFSFVGGAFHPSAMGIRFHRYADDAVGVVTLAPSFAGPPERAHGGAVAALVDETMGALNRIQGRRAYTASLKIDFRGAAPIGEVLKFRARLTREDGRKIHVGCTGRSDDRLFCEADGIFVTPDQVGE